MDPEDESGLSTILKDGLISGHLALPSLLSPENTAGKEKRAFACSCCGKRFPRASDLRKHERSHSDERPFACPLCRRAFKHRSHLNDHERRHRGLRPFPCTFCPKAFAKASDLKRHQNTMHGTRTATGISISRRISLVEPLLHQIVGT
uniref:C2H2-type domain-containing protein n=1 Tax=Eptatretus burgeri TaxID=7764 RepID=A0A8C4Q9A1_EPTBU